MDDDLLLKISICLNKAYNETFTEQWHIRNIYNYIMSELAKK
jgi:hypothetical protein